MRHHRVAAVAGALTLAAALSACEVNGTPTTPTPPTTAAATSTASSSAPASLTAEQQAYAEAEKVYRAWVANYAEAVATFDATKLNPNLATPEILSETTNFFAKVRAQEPAGTTAKFNQDIKSVIGTRYLPDQEVQLQVCAVTNARFLRDGVDITSTTPGGPPAPPNTTARANQIQLTSPDKETWRVSYFVLDGGQGASC